MGMEEIKRKIYSSATFKDSTNVAFRSTTPMAEALEDAAKHYGMNRSHLIVFILEDFLQRELEKGTIKPPEDEGPA